MLQRLLSISKIKISFDYFLAFLLICNSLPFFVWGGHLHNYLLYPLLLYYIASRVKVKQRFLLSLLFFICIWASSLEENIGSSLSYISVIFLFILKDQCLSNLYEKIISLLTVLTLVSIVSYIVVRFVGVDLPHYSVPPLQPSKGYGYLCYPLFTRPDIPFEFRFYGLFDEAGANGTVSALILYIENYDLSKKRNIVFLVNGLLSVSFFFILTTLIFYLINSIETIKRHFMAVILAVSALGAVYFVTKDDEYFDFYIYQRLSLNDDHQLNGDNRTDASFEIAYNNSLSSSDKWLGRGKGSSSKVAEDSSSYKLIGYDYGVIWFLLFCIFWIGLILKSSAPLKTKITHLFFISALVYQRPIVFTPFYSLLLFMTYTLYINKSNVRSNHTNETTNEFTPAIS